MVEVLGIVAGGMGIASLAIQIGDSIIKLKEFSHAVKEAPEEVKYLVEEIETLSLVLSEIGASGDEDEVSQIGNASFKKCLDLCRRGAEVLGTVVGEAEQEIAKRKRIGSVKVVLKKGAMEKLRDRLRTVQSMLMLSNQTYSEALQKHRHELQRQWAEHHQRELGEVKLVLTKPIIQVSTSCEEPSGAVIRDQIPIISGDQIHRQDNEVEGNLQQVNFTARRRKRLMARLRTPVWLSISSNAWEFCCYRANSGWMFTAQTYRVVHENSLILQLAKDGDVRGIQELFEKNLASPYDREDSGHTVLDVSVFNSILVAHHQSSCQLPSHINKIAASYLRLDVCRLLLNEGADPNISYSRSSLDVANTGWLFAGRDGQSSIFLDVVRCLAQGVDQDVLDISLGQTLLPTSTEAFEFLFNQSTYTCKSSTAQERFGVIAAIASSPFYPITASMVRAALGGKQLDKLISPLNDHRGRNLLHHMAGCLGEHQVISMWRQGTKELRNAHVVSKELDRAEHYWNQWDQQGLTENLLLVRDLILAGCSLTECNKSFRTPLLEICHGMTRVQKVLAIFSTLQPLVRRWQARAVRNPEMIIRVWLQQLAEAGVDLMEYGLRESHLHLRHRVSTEWAFWDEFHNSPTYGQTNFTLRLISFTYGSSPGDWQFWFTEAMDDSFVEFWHFIDHPEQGMPGAWNEYD